MVWLDIVVVVGGVWAEGGNHDSCLSYRAYPFPTVSYSPGHHPIHHYLGESEQHLSKFSWHGVPALVDWLE